MAKAHLWSELTWPALAELAARDTLAVVILGCTEQHGRHLPVDTDSFQAETVAALGCELAATRHQVDTVRLPLMPFGPASEHYGFAGSLSLSNELYVRFIKELVASVIDSGFRRIGVLRSCGGHWAVPGAVWDAKADAVRRGKDVVLHLLRVDEDWTKVRAELFAGLEGAHAASIETSLCLAKRPELVVQEEIAPPDLKNFRQRYLEGGEVFLFGELSDTGALGSPVGASAQLGEKAWQAIAEGFAARVALIERLDREVLTGSASPPGSSTPVAGSPAASASIPAKVPTGGAR